MFGCQIVREQAILGPSQAGPQARRIHQTMKIYFCDGCNESIPLTDIQAGQATTIRGKLFCRNCIPLGAGAGATPPAPATRRGTHPLLVIVLLALVGYTVWRDLPRLSGGASGQKETSAELGSKADAQSLRKTESQLGALRDSLAEVSRQQTIQRSDVDALRASAADISRGLDQLREAIDGLQRSQAETGQLIEKLHIQENTTQSLAARIDALADLVAAAQNRMSMAEAAAAATVAAPAAADPADVTAAAERDELRRQLKDPDAGRRFDAVDRIGKGRHKELAPDLVPMLKDDDLFVRSLAMQVIGDFGQVEAVPALLDVLSDPSATIRKYAAEALVRLTGFDPPYDPGASQGERDKAVKRWKDWIAGHPQ